MLSDEVLKANANQINNILDYAEKVGAGGPFLAAIAALTMSADDFEVLMDPTASNETVLEDVHNRLLAAGVKTS